MAVVDDNEPALLLTKHEREVTELLLDENKVILSLLPNNEENVRESNI